MQTVEPPMQERQRREGGAGEGVSVPVDPLLFVGNGRKKVLIRTQPCWYPDRGLPALRTIGKFFVIFTCDLTPCSFYLFTLVLLLE